MHVLKELFFDQSPVYLLPVACTHELFRLSPRASTEQSLLHFPSSIALVPPSHPPPLSGGGTGRLRQQKHIPHSPEHGPS